MYPAFENRSFCFFFGAQVTSFVGTVLQSVAQGWLVNEMTHSVFLVALNAFFAVAPTVLLAPVGGAIADRYNTKTLLAWTTWLGLLQAAMLGTLFVSGHLPLIAINVLALASGILNGLDSPVRYAGIVKMVDRELIPSAKALNGTLVNLGFILGPSIGGVLIAKFGVGPTFFVNAASFLPMIAVLPLLKFRKQHQPAPPNVQSPFKPFVATIEGIRYASSHPVIGSLLLTLGFATMFGMSYRAILPVVATQVFHSGPEGYGWLTAAPGFGALIGAAIISRMSRSLPVAGLMVIYMTTLGLSLVFFSEVKSLALAIAILTFTGFALESVIIIVQSTTATASDGNMVGRIMGCGASIFFGGIALGSFVIGYVARVFGSPFAIRLNGIALLTVAIFLLFKREAYTAALAKG